jgi:hypothetical protein
VSNPVKPKKSTSSLPPPIPKERILASDAEPSRSIKQIEFEYLLAEYRSQKVDLQHELLKLGYPSEKVYSMTLNELKGEMKKFRDD